MDRLAMISRWSCGHNHHHRVFALPSAVSYMRALCERRAAQCAEFGPLAINFHQRVTAQGLTRSK